MRDAERFWGKVQSGPPQACWNWQAASINSGYGVFQRSRTGLVGSRQVTAHRYACELTSGPIPPGMEVCHRCDNKLCVNPNHLYVGTRQDNVRDAVERGRYRCATRKLCERDVLEIRASPASCRLLAVQYGVTPSAISNIRRGKRWSHLSDKTPDNAAFRTRPGTV